MTTEARLIRVIDHIHANPGGDLSLDALADVACLSRFHFHRVFRASQGETVIQTVRRMRLHRAATDLVTGSAPVDRIALANGYPNRASFVRAFAETYGETPASFRKRGALRPFPRTQKPEITLMHPIEIRFDGPRRLAAWPHSGPYPTIAASFEKLYATLGARGLIDKSGPMIGVYYDDPSTVAPEALRSHAGAEVAPDQPVEAPLVAVALPAARHAVLTFRGPYAGLPAAYDALYAGWLPGSGEEPADSPPFEVYRNSPMDTPQEDLITEICLPLKG